MKAVVVSFSIKRVCVPQTHIHKLAFNLLESIPKEIVWICSLAIILLCILFVLCPFCQLWTNCLLCFSVKHWTISLAVLFLIHIEIKCICEIGHTFKHTLNIYSIVVEVSYSGVQHSYPVNSKLNTELN